MKIKKTRSSILKEKSALQIPKVTQLNLEYVKDKRIKQLIEELSKESYVDFQINLLKEFQPFLSCENQDQEDICIIIDTLTYIYVTLNPKNVLRKTIQRLLLSACKSTEVVTEKTSENIQLIIKHSNGVNNNDVVNGISSCFENFSFGIKAVSNCLPIVLEFLTRQFEDLLKLWSNADKSKEIDVFLHNVIRVLVCVLQQCDFSNRQLDSINSRLLQCADKIIQYDFPFDVKSNSSIILIAAANHMQEQKLSWLIILDCCLNKKSLQIQPIINLNNEICIFVGILNGVPSDVLVSTKISDQSVLKLIFKRLLELSESESHNPSEMLNINRVLVVLFRNISQNLSFNDVTVMLELGLGYVWTHLDHYIDTIRHSTKQLLTICVKIVSSRTETEKEHLLKSMLYKIHRLSDLRSAKYVSITVLSQSVGCNAILSAIPNLVSTLISHLEDPSIASYVNTTYERLMKQSINEIDEEIWLEKWICPLIKKAQSPKLQDLLAYGFTLKPILLKSVIGENLVKNEDLLGVFLKVVKISNGSINWRDLLKVEIVNSAIYHQSDEVRISVLSLIVDSHKTTEQFCEWDFEFLLKYLHYNCNTQDPAIRQEIVGFFKKMLSRYQESYNLISKQQKSLLHYLTFINKFRSLLFENLFPSASYGRRVTVLELLVAGQNIFEKYCSVENRRMEVRVLKRCLNDSYEGNKKYAVILLRAYSQEELEMQLLSEYIEESSSIRPADCLSIAYKIQLTLENNSGTYVAVKTLLTHLQLQLSVAKSNLLKAAASGPMYGTLFCIRHLIENANLTEISSDDDWKLLVNLLIEVCFELSAVVAPVINSSSPEGHLPEEAAADETVTSQMVLICSWRTAKEVSLLLGELALNGYNDQNELKTSLVSEEQLLEMGKHFIAVLTETKHRGAFEQAYIGFNKLCLRLWRCASLSLNSLPRLWLRSTMDAVTSASSESKLCATRRSAGVPFMVQVLITSELGTGHTDNFTKCMSGLLNVARNSENVESRTHSLNILRALYRHNQLGELVSPYVGDGIEVAVDGFTSKDWSERNSSTLLFSSLMVRIFGVQRTKDSEKPSSVNCLSARVFFLRYTSLHTFLLNQLSSGHKSVLYPVLLLLARLYPCSVEEDTWLQPFFPHVLHCLSSNTFKTRQLACRAIVPMLHHCTVHQMSILLTQLIDVTAETNYCHGILVLLTMLLKNEKILRGTDETLDVISVVKSTVWILNSCDVVATAYVQFLTLLTASFKESCANNELWQTYLTILQQLQETISKERIFYRATQHLQLHINANLIMSQESTSAATRIIFNNLSADSIECKIFALNIVNYLNDTETHPLYKTSELEFSEIEFEFVKSLNSKTRGTLLNDVNAQIFEHVHKINAATVNTDYLVAFYILLSNCPLLIEKVFKNGSDNCDAVLDNILEKIVNDNDALNCAILSTVEAYLLLTSSDNAVRPTDLNFDNVLDALQRFSEPQMSVSCRLQVANVLNSCAHLNGKSVRAERRQRLWLIKLMLHEDEDQVVRDCISNVVMSQKSRESLLADIANDLPAPDNVALLLNISLRTRSFDKGQLFETDEWNDYTEELFLTINALSVARTFLRGASANDKKDNVEIVEATINEILTLNLLTIDAIRLDCFKAFLNVYKHLRETSLGKTQEDVNDSIQNLVDGVEGSKSLTFIQREKLNRTFEMFLSL